MTKEEQFEALWRCYPRRVGKGTARKAFVKAIKLTTLEVMIEAITKYVANKPAWQDYKHPATWLNSEGWCDEWEPQQPKAGTYTISPAVTRSVSREEYLAAARRREEREFSR